VSTSPRVPKAPTSGQSADSAAATGPLKASRLAKKVRAAGGVVWRRTPAGTEVVLVHRPAYDDWALPKGKVEQRESDEEAALREVREETGLSCRLGPELPSTTYRDAEGHPKVVRYWAMTVLPGTGAIANAEPVLAAESKDEIDDLLWVPLEEARQRFTYARDVVVLDAFEDYISRSNVRRQEVNNVAEGEPKRDEAN
jgi:8-oxo-dGTP diphosphatase